MSSQTTIERRVFSFSHLPIGHIRPADDHVTARPRIAAVQLYTLVFILVSFDQRVLDCFRSSRTPRLVAQRPATNGSPANKALKSLCGIVQGIGYNNSATLASDIVGQITHEDHRYWGKYQLTSGRTLKKNPTFSYHNILTPDLSSTLWTTYVFLHHYTFLPRA